MKQSTKFITGLLLISFAIVIITSFALNKNTEQNAEKNLAEYGSSNGNISAAYYEDGVDEDYNYIINYEILVQYDMPAVGMERIGDEIDRLLKESGTYGSKVEIIMSKKHGTYIEFQAVPEKSKDSIVYFKYQFSTNEMDIYLAE